MCSPGPVRVRLPGDDRVESGHGRAVFHSQADL